eukprot:3976832-Prymnesium_polylepis.1
MAQPLHLMQRRTFLEPSRHGNAAAALEAVDARIVKLREQVELAKLGLADHQDPGLQQISGFAPGGGGSVVCRRHRKAGVAEPYCDPGCTDATAGPGLRARSLVCRLGCARRDGNRRGIEGAVSNWRLQNLGRHVLPVIVRN